MYTKGVMMYDVLRIKWDDSTRTYSEYDEFGELTLSRPYTPEENAETDITDAEEAVKAQREAVRQLVKGIIEDLKAEKVRAQTVIDKPNANITAGDTKDVARAAKRIADAAIDLARFVQDL